MAGHPAAAPAATDSMEEGEIPVPEGQPEVNSSHDGLSQQQRAQEEQRAQETFQPTASAPARWDIHSCTERRAADVLHRGLRGETF